MRLSTSNAVLLLVLGSAQGHRMAVNQQGCASQDTKAIAHGISCHGSSTGVSAAAIEQYGSDFGALKQQLGQIGCDETEAAAFATWVVERCQTGSASEPLELRRRLLRGKREVPIEARDDDDSAASTSLITATNTNPYVVYTSISGSLSAMTCMTSKTFTTTACSTSKTDGTWSTSCTAVPTSTPTCLPGLLCAFSSTTGAFSCQKKTPIQGYGYVILAIFGALIACMLIGLGTMCMRERAAVKAHRREAEEVKALLGRKGTGMGMSVQVAELGPAQVPLMEAVGGRLDEQERMQEEAPEIVVTGNTPTVETAHTIDVEFPAMPYDPFADGRRN